MSDIEMKVKQIIADQLNKHINDINLTADIAKDLGADSLDLVEIVMALEDHFKIIIPDKETSDLRTTKSIVNKIKELK